MLVPWRVPERSIPDCAIPKPAPNVSGNSWRKILVEGSRGYIGQVEDKVLFFFSEEYLAAGPVQTGNMIVKRLCHTEL